MDTFLKKIKPILKELNPPKVIVLVASVMALLSLTFLALPLFLLFVIVALIAYLTIQK